MATYACSDIHGFYSIYEQINNFIKPEDRVIFLGDATDRGPHGWKTLKAILDNPQWEYVRGNHDEMVLEYIGVGFSDLHTYNGGRSTEKEIDAESDIIVHKYYMKLAEKPFSMEYKNKDGKLIWLSHSGCISNNPDDLVWSREHWYQNAHKAGYDYVIHGHTPIQYLLEDLAFFETYEEDDPNMDWEEGTPCHYMPKDADGTELSHSIDIDCCTIATRKSVLLNLDTFEYHTFIVGEEELPPLDYKR